MELVISHKNTDFDGFASQLAATILYPRARILLSHTLERNVREFLTIYRSALPLITEDDIDPAYIKRVIIVDTQLINRVGALKEILQQREAGKYNFEVIIYDHHTEFESDIKPDKRIVEPVGATSTILIEEIMRRQIELSSLQSTILGLGVYEDTGVFTFASTTYRDFAVTAYLARHGMKLNVIMDFVNRELSKDQLELLNELINNSESEYVKGVNIVFSFARIDKYIVDIALVAHKLRDIENINVLFIIISMQNKVHIIGRSRLLNVDIDRILRHLGGGGHPTAASATLREEKDPEEVKRMLIEICKREIKPRVVARDIMQRRFYIIDENLPIYEAFRIMIMFNLDALPVTNKRSRNIVGIIRKIDVEKAFHHRLGHSRVKGYMSEKLVYVSEDASLEKIEHTLIENNIGLIFVKNNKGEISGIITRDILLKTQYNLKRETFSLYEEAEIHLDNFRYLMEEHFPPEYLDLMHLIGKKADELDMNAYIVGGIVRDMFLKIENYDLDIVVEGKSGEDDKAYGIILAKEIAKKLPGKLVVHEKFKTAKIFLRGGKRIDFATARTEFYSMPAALPEVDVSSIKQDLYRRDFTINSMAIKINPDEFGRLYDFFNGLKDLREKRLRVLYSLSFIDDPTRIFRAVRFEQRLGFKLDRESLKFLKYSIEKGFLKSLASQRVRDEFYRIFEEANPGPAIRRMNELNILKTLDEELELSSETMHRIDQLTIFRARYNAQEISEYITHVGWHILYFCLLFENLEIEKAKRLLLDLCIPKKEVKDILDIYNFAGSTARGLARARRNCRIYELLNQRSESFFIYLYIYYPTSRPKILFYFKKLMDVSPFLKGNELIQLGVIPGPRIRELLKDLTCAQLDGKIKNKDDAIKFIKRKL